MTRGIKKKANYGDHIDRISDLPSNVIDGILQHLPIVDLVRTSILSRKWRYMWLSTPQLKFGIDFFEYCYNKFIEGSEIPEIITKVLFLHNGPISMFTLKMSGSVFFFTPELERLWKCIRFLPKRGIKHLELRSHEHCFVIPSHLFYCQGLTYLKLERFKMSLPSNFCGFKSLLDLHLIDMTFVSDAFERLISGCPVLNALTISCDSIYDCIFCFNNSTAPGFDCIGVSGFIQGLPRIQRLCLTEHYIEVLSKGAIPQTLQKLISSIKYLELDGVDFNQPRPLLFIVSLLESSSNLVELVINGVQWSSRGDVPPLQDNLRALDRNSCCLRKVNITITTVCDHKYVEHALNLTRFLLANCSSLEVLTFQIGLYGREELDNPTLTRLFSISQDLLKMQSRN